MGFMANERENIRGILGDLLLDMQLVYLLDYF